MNQYALTFKSITEIIKFISEQSIQFVDLNFTDICGKWHHMTLHAGILTKDVWEDGVAFDGSSIAGWATIDKSDMMLRPDISRAAYDPFAAQKTIKVFCDIFDPETNKPYALDPRSVAKLAIKYLSNSKIADTAYFGPEPEFFIFNDVKIYTQNHNIGHCFDSDEGSYNSNRHYPTGNMGHRPSHKGGYVPESPVDSLSDIRAEMLTVLENMGVNIEKHHHEVAASQCELGIRYDTLLNAADNVQLYKHVVHNVAHSYGKTATFMPKPIVDDNGSGMHVHQSLWKGKKPLFAGDKYAGLSENALYYIGGILKHARALNAFTNPTTNSYKRLVPGYEAPTALSYSERNRSAACRIPYTNAPSGKRVEARFPDATANPYLAFSAMLMAGIDGIDNKIHPGDALDVDLYDNNHSLSLSSSLSDSLKTSLDCLNNDCDFLLKGDVFSKELIESFCLLKESEIKELERTTHPVEVKLYYSS